MASVIIRGNMAGFSKLETNQSLNGFEVQINLETKDRLVNTTRNAFEIARIVSGRNRKFYMYGGAIRGLIMGQGTPCHDFDLIGDFDLEQIIKEYPDQVIGRWDDVQTVRLRLGGVIYDFTSTDDIYGRLSSVDMDSSGIVLSPDGRLFDLFGGIESLRKREVRFIDPDTKITTDPARILRAFKFAAIYGFAIEEKTMSSIMTHAHLLSSAPNLRDYVLQIFSLEHDIRLKTLGELHRYGIDRYLEIPAELDEAFAVLDLEEDIGRIPQVGKVAAMFETDIFLVGGALRDLLWGKRINDLDFKVKLPITDVVRVLESHGYKRCKDHNTSEGEYYVSKIAGVVGVMIDGRDIHLSEVDTTDFSQMISEGDLNFSSCIYNPRTKRVENPEVVSDILKKRLLFSNPGRAMIDPSIVVNALKQISRQPDLEIPDQTKEIIQASLGSIARFVRITPSRSYIIGGLCGNLNSGEVLNMFDPNDRQIFDGYPRKRHKLKVTSGSFVSTTVEELATEDKLEIIELIRLSFKDKYKDGKEFPSKINSVVYERRDGQITACCLVDGERVYVASAKSGHDWIHLFTDLSKWNYNVWCTVDAKNSKVQALCSIGGMKIEQVPETIIKILVSNGGKKAMNLRVYEENGITVFKDITSPTYPQVLLRS